MMKKYFSIILIGIITVFSFSCSKTAPQKKSTDSGKKIHKINPNSTNKKEVSQNTISPKNVVQFLTEYGKKNPETKVTIKTRLGDIKIKLYTKTPLYRANFIFLSKEGYFNTTCFYRVVPNFIIQGGDSENLNTLRYRNKYKNYFLPANFVSEYKHKYGALAAARDWENNPTKKSSPFEFYIVQNKKGAHHLDGEHTVFGEVISGFSVVDKIANLKSGKDEWPLKDVFMKVEVIE